MYSHDLNVHCEIWAYSRFCETKELKGENNSVLRSLFSLPPTTYWWASSCILGNQWLKRFHRVSAWLRVIWQIYELCWTGSKWPENNGHSARWIMYMVFKLFKSWNINIIGKFKYRIFFKLKELKKVCKYILKISIVKYYKMIIVHI